VSDYGAFRDLQRHRLLSIDWQPLTTRLGYDLPDIVAQSGSEERFAESMARSADLYQTLVAEYPVQAPYAVALAYRIHYVMQMNAREAMHVLELRSGPQGHPATVGSPSPCTGRSPTSPGTERSPRPWSTWITARPTSNASTPSGAPKHDEQPDNPDIFLTALNWAFVRSPS